MKFPKKTGNGTIEQTFHVCGEALFPSVYSSPSCLLQTVWSYRSLSQDKISLESTSEDKITINNKLSLFPQEIPAINLRPIKLIPVINTNGLFPNQSHLILHLRLHLPKCNIFKATEGGNSQTLLQGGCPRAKTAWGETEGKSILYFSPNNLSKWSSILKNRLLLMLTLWEWFRVD